MPPGFEKCPNCGAPLEASPDGRAVHCPYCGAGEARGVDPVRLAEALRSEWRTVEELYEGLARRLAAQFPERTRVRRSGGFLSAKRLEELELAADDAVYRMRRNGGGIVAERAEVVRGIAVKTEALPLDDWIRSLCHSLAAVAASSARSLAALRGITTD